MPKEIKDKEEPEVKIADLPTGISSAWRDFADKRDAGLIKQDGSGQVTIEGDKKEEDENKTEIEDKKADIQSTEKVDEKEEKKEEVEEDKILEIDYSKIVDRHGKPIGEKSREVIKNIETDRNKWAERAKKNQERIKELESKNGSTTEEIQKKFSDLEAERNKIKEELDGKRKQIDDLFFEESDEFRNTFINPIKASNEKIGKYLGGIKEEHHEDVTELVNKADGFLGNPKKEIPFMQVSDEIAETYLKGSIGQRFLAEMNTIWDLHIRKAEASADKGKAKQEVQSKIRESSDRGLKTFKDRLSSEVSAFELTPVGKFYTEQKPELGFKDIVPKRKELAERVVGDFVSTGVVTAELSDIILRGVMGDVYQNERKWLLEGFSSAREISKRLEDENKDLKDKLKKLSASGSGGTYKSKGKDEEEKQEGSAMGGAIRKFRERVS